MAKTLDAMKLTVKQLKGAKYNPRTITTARLGKLQESISTFGDLSGVVFNIKTGVLVSGHQRMKTIEGLDSKIVQKPHTDKLGTVAIGHVVAKSKKGNEIRIPYRAVSWDLNREKAANIAANAHGGVFDKDKLAMVLADLGNSKTFDLDIVGLDPLTLKSLGRAAAKEGGKPITDFKEYGADIADDSKHECPRCKYRFS